MRLPWTRDAQAEKAQEQAEARYVAVRAHLSILLRELQATLDRIEDKRRRGLP